MVTRYLLVLTALSVIQFNHAAASKYIVYNPEIRVVYYEHFGPLFGVCHLTGK